MLLLCQGRARFQGLEDDADEEAFEAADGLASALAFGFLALEVGTCGGVVAGLGDRDPVERGVELAVAAAVEAVSLDPAGAGFERCDAAVPGKLCVAFEAVDRAELGEQLGCRHWPASWELEQRRRRLDCAELELAIELFDHLRERPDPACELSRELHLELLILTSEPSIDPFEVRGTTE